MKIIHKTCKDYQFIKSGRKACIDVMIITYFTVQYCVVCMYVYMYACMYVGVFILDSHRIALSYFQRWIIQQVPCSHKRTRNLHTPMLIHIHYSVDILHTNIQTYIHTYIDTYYIHGFLIKMKWRISFWWYVCMYVLLYVVWIHGFLYTWSSVQFSDPEEITITSYIHCDDPRRSSVCIPLPRFESNVKTINRQFWDCDIQELRNKLASIHRRSTDSNRIWNTTRHHSIDLN